MERSDLYQVPDMIGEPLTAWRAWRMQAELWEHLAAPDLIGYQLDEKLPEPIQTEKRTHILLSSVNQGFTWEPRKVMQGICKSAVSPFKDKPHPDSETPKEGCSCGIHALDNPLLLTKTDYVTIAGRGRHDFVWGEIAMWGKIIRGETGIKSQYAYPKELFIRADAKADYRGADGARVAVYKDEIKELLSEQYGVPVHVLKTIKRVDENTDEVWIKLEDGTKIYRGGDKDGNR